MKKEFLGAPESSLRLPKATAPLRAAWSPSSRASVKAMMNQYGLHSKAELAIDIRVSVCFSHVEWRTRMLNARALKVALTESAPTLSNALWHSSPRTIGRTASAAAS